MLTCCTSGNFIPSGGTSIQTEAPPAAAPPQELKTNINNTMTEPGKHRFRIEASLYVDRFRGTTRH
jgi:hypothetical protein